ncbi:MAG: HEAT repeat domain-containing protein [Myxococcales bacterium]
MGKASHGWLLVALAAVSCGPSRDDELAALSSPDATARAQAIAELGKAGDDDNLGDVIAHVGDPDMLVRSSVAAALANYDDRRSSDALGELAGDPVESVQTIAVRSLARQKNPRAKAYLLLAYRRDGSAVRAAVAEGLRRGGGSPAEAVRAEAKALWEQLSSALTKGGAVERAGAAEELGRSGRPEAVARLGPYVAADSRAIACAAAAGLGASGLPEAREPLEAMLAEVDPELQQAGLSGLQALGAPESAPALSKLASKGGRLGREAVDVLAGLPGGGAALCGVALADDAAVAARAAELAAAASVKCDLAPLLAKLSRGPPQQQAALAALAAFGGTLSDADARRVVSLLRGGPPEVRPLAARVAGAFQLTAAAADLRKAYGEARAKLEAQRERWVKEPLPLRYAPAFESPGAVGGSYRDHVQDLMSKLAARGAHVDQDGVAPVGALFNSEAGDEASLLAETGAALVALGQPDAADIAKALAADPSPAVRRVACRAALALPPEAGWPVLAGLADDADPEVKERALRLVPRLLAKAGPAQKQAGELLLTKLLAHPDGSSDELAIEGLAQALPGGAAPEPGAIEGITEALARPGTAASAAEALARLAPRAVAESALLDRLRVANSPALPKVLDALAELQAADAAPRIRPLLFHVNPAVRAAAARALLAIGDSASKPDVEALRDDYYVLVRQAAGARPAAPPAAASAAK